MRTTTGAVVTKRVKAFLATWRPAGGVVRVVIIQEDDGSWRAVLCTDPKASVAAIVQVVLDRWGIEPNLHDLKEVEGIEQVPVRRVWSNGGGVEPFPGGAHTDRGLGLEPSSGVAERPK